MRRSRWLVIGGFAIAIAALGMGLSHIRDRMHTGGVPEGQAAYERGEWDVAETWARGRLRIAPQDADAWRLLARASLRQGHDETARSIYQRIGGSEAMKAEDLYLLGRALARKGDRFGAEMCWGRGLGLDPAHAPILWELARLRLARGDVVNAAEDAESLSARPGWEARGTLLLGQARMAQADWDDAVACFRRGLTLDPRAQGAALAVTAYRKLMARALLRLGRPVEARADLTEVNTTEAGQQDAETAWLLSRASLQEGDVGKAAAWLIPGDRYRDENPLEPEPAPYTGAARCAGCHRGIYEKQQSSLHSRTYLRASELGDSLMPREAVADRHDPAWRYAITRRDGQFLFESARGQDVYRALVDYAFGSGDRGMTLVGHDGQGRIRECRISRYADGPVWDLTTGQKAALQSADMSLGRVLQADELRACFLCHTTDARAAASRIGPAAADRGIGCERCHGPGANHLKAVAAGASFADLAIVQPRLASPARVTSLCAECHSPPGGRPPARSDPSSIRFQGATLTWSRCFTESRGALGCTTCHDPHRDAEKGDSSYEMKCLSCHSGGASPSATGDTVTHALRCPVNPAAGCISCHMPRVKDAVPHSSFTDHFIRIH